MQQPAPSHASCRHQRGLRPGGHPLGHHQRQQRGHFRKRPALGPGLPTVSSQAGERERSISADIMGSRPPPPTLALLTGERNRAADAALLEALPHLESHARSTAVDMLIRRAHAPTLTALVLRFSDYDDDLKSLISRRVGGLHAATRAAIESATLEERSSAIELIRQGDEGKLAYLL